MTYWNEQTAMVAGGVGFLGSYVVEGLRRTVEWYFATPAASQAA
jgi:nucleoside-diphosphate-sugar epimerase